MTGSDPYLFSTISGVAVDPAGRIYAVDYQTDEIRVFDAAGEFLRVFGGSGEGPGEIGRACCPGWDAEGRLWVREVTNRRYSAFDVSGPEPEFAHSQPVSHPGAGLWARTTFDIAGRLVDVGPPRGGGIDARVRYHVTADGVVDSSEVIPSPPNEEIGMHTVERSGPDGPSIWFVYQPFGPRHLIAHGPAGRWATSISSEYRVDLHRPDGTVVEILRPGERGPELTAEERARGEEAMEADRERLSASLPYGLPDRKPPLQELFFDDTGRLWVERNVIGDRRLADVYDDGGAMVARYEWPARVRVGIWGWASRGMLVGITRDSLDVERIARVRFPSDGGR
ncbi:MAG: hypothetical protein R3195_14690 [Gemmatimonadota bacterium]|nr:hypothetical protein [Gemmatimonadota bacterium]